MRTGAKRPLLDSLQIEARTQTIVSPGVKKYSYSIFMGQAGNLPPSSTGTLVLRIQNPGQKGGARQGEQRTQDNQQPSHLVPCPSVNLQHGHIHRPDNTSKGPPQPGGRAPRAHQGLGWREVCCLHLEAYRPPNPEWQARERRPGPGKRQSFPCRRGERQGEGRGCGRPVAGRRGALAWACSSVHPGGAGAAGEPAEGAVRPLRRPRGDTSPSCRRLGPPAGEGLPGSPTASSCLAYSPAAESARARRPPAARPPALSLSPAALRRSPRPASPAAPAARARPRPCCPSSTPTCTGTRPP